MNTVWKSVQNHHSRYYGGNVSDFGLMTATSLEIKVPTRGKGMAFLEVVGSRSCWGEGMQKKRETARRDRGRLALLVGEKITDRSPD